MKERVNLENLSIKLEGQYQDEIYQKEENGKEVLVTTQSGKIDCFPFWKNNLIVDVVKALLAGLFANESSFTGGILYHALGRGDVSWDTTVPDPGSSDVALYDEHFRKSPDSINYLDGSNNVVSFSHSVSKIEVTTTFDYGDSGADGSIREQGLFGGDATGSLDSGIMINAIRHKEIYKDNTIKIVRRIRIQF